MTKKTLLILAGISVGGCCLLGSGVAVLGALAGSDDAEPPPGRAEAAEAPSEAEPSGVIPAAAAAAGADRLGGYRIWGRATATADGFADSLVGHWMLMDGASSIESIESISEDVVRVRNNRSGELWHFIFEEDGSYAFRYVVTYNRRALINVERGEWASDGAVLTLTPASCTARTASETTDCTEPNARAYALTTVQMDELTTGNQPGSSWQGVRFTGPSPKFASGANPLSYLQLQRVR